jgi:hypothetical protein
MSLKPTERPWGAQAEVNSWWGLAPEETPNFHDIKSLDSGDGRASLLEFYGYKCVARDSRSPTELYNWLKKSPENQEYKKGMEEEKKKERRIILEEVVEQWQQQERRRNEEEQKTEGQEGGQEAKDQRLNILKNVIGDWKDKNMDRDSIREGELYDTLLRDLASDLEKERGKENENDHEKENGKEREWYQGKGKGKGKVKEYPQLLFILKDLVDYWMKEDEEKYGRLIILEDLAGDWVEMLGCHLGIPRSFFELHWATPEDHSLGIARVPLGQDPLYNFILSYTQIHQEKDITNDPGL